MRRHHHYHQYSKRYDYAYAATLETAEAKLERLYATGDVTDLDWPSIETRRATRNGATYYVITLNG